MIAWDEPGYVVAFTTRLGGVSQTPYDSLNLTTGTGDDPDLSQICTPEFYFGALHPTPQDRSQQPRRGEAAYADKLTDPQLRMLQGTLSSIRQPW